MKQREIARQLGITHVHLNQILTGRGNPSARLALRLEQATGIDRQIWVFGTAEERRAAWNKAKEAQP